MLHFNTFLKVYNKLILVGKESVYTHSHLYTINMQFLKTMDGKHNDKQIYFIMARHDDDINWTHFPRYWPFVRGTTIIA